MPDVAEGQCPAHSLRSDSFAESVGGWVRSWRRNLRYIAVAATCAVVNNIILIALVKGGINYFVGVWLAFVPMLFLAFALHARVTFQVDASRRSLLRYALATLANYPLWIASLFVLDTGLKLPITIAAPVGTVIAFVGNYVAAHWAILYRRRG